jgi:hypothetical protein
LQREYTCAESRELHWFAGHSVTVGAGYGTQSMSPL